MRIEIDTGKDDKGNGGIKGHHVLYFIIAVTALVFAALYIQGFIEYTK